LRAAVEALLLAHEASGSLLNRPPPLVPTTAYHPNSMPGLIIAGRYTLVEKIGAGGMGEVWVAKQTEPVKRKVALKLIKSGMDSRAVLTRFEAERQALALMDHPNIARVLDGGLTPDERPFFVMELVNGLPLTKFCDEVRLTPRQRLELFVPICQAVQHAHQKGIIHRDLKPANILVTLLDGKPIPKVIDFGVAKATAGKLTDDSVSTQFGAVIGTLEYMAPEQAGYSSVDIDTRADIYSLGVILYELLTGLRPIDGKRLKQAALTEMVRILKEEEPSRPSTRLSAEEALPSLAALRQTEPHQLMALLRGELDWVVMKCLEKQRDRRYETASGLAQDIQRYLADEAVEARPPSTGYRLGKFLKRHKGPVLAASLVLLTLLVGMAGTIGGLFEARRQAGKAEAARDREARERGYAEAIAHFVKDDLLALTSVEGQQRFGGEGLSHNATLRELLDRAAAKLNERQNLAPRTEAELCWIIGVSYRGVGEAARAIPFLKRSVALYRQESGPAAEATLKAQNSLAVAYRAAGDYGLAVLLHEETLQVQKARLGPDHPHTLASMTNLAEAYRAARKPDLAVPLLEETLKLSKARFGPGHPHTLTSSNNLALAYRTAGKLDLAVPLHEETLQLQKVRLGPDHPDTLTSMKNVAQAYLQVGKLDLALAIFEETLKLYKVRLGTDHPGTITSMNDLAATYQTAGKLEQALALHEETLKLCKARLGPEHPHTLQSMSNLAEAYRAAGKLHLAVPLLEETLKLCKARLGPEHPHTLQGMSSLASAYWSAKQLDRSIPLLEEALKRQEAKLGRDHPDTLVIVANLGVNYKDAGRPRDALPLLEEADRATQKYPTLRWVRTPLLDAYARTGERAKAVHLLQQQLAEGRQTLPKDSPQLASLLAQIGRGLLQQHQWAEAELLLRECLAIRDKKQPDGWLTFNTQSMLGGALLGQKKYGDAEPLLRAGYEGLKDQQARVPPQGQVRIPEALERLVQLYDATQRKDEAARWRKELEALQAAQKKAEKQP
jgi:serine/threonine protein kinase